jgi:hypothetical protein
MDLEEMATFIQYDGAAVDIGIMGHTNETLQDFRRGDGSTMKCWGCLHFSCEIYHTLDVFIPQRHVIVVTHPIFWSQLYI